MKKIVISCSLLFLVAACQPQKGGTSGVNVKPSSENEKVLFAMGAMLGKNLQNLSLEEKELRFVMAGIHDSALGKKLAIDPGKYQMKVRQFFEKKINAKSINEKKKGKAFIEKFKKESGVKVTASGLAYKIIKAGSGKTPAATDTVEVHYEGKLIDGTVFDSSLKRGKSISFPLNRVIKGWTEGLQLLKEGGKIKLVIPSDLAYGDRGAPPKIPGGATLIFDVQLLKVKDAPKPVKAKMVKKSKKVKKHKK